MLNFKENIVLENDRVLLRPLEASDFQNLLNFSINEPELWTYSLMQATNANELKNYVNSALQNRQSALEYPFIVYDKTNESFAGTTRFYGIQEKDKCLSIGYTWYGKAFQGTGLNKAVKYLLLEFTFETLEYERIEFRTDAENKKSIAALKSIGAKEEGKLRSNGVKPDGTRRDSTVLSILRTEWFQIKNNELAGN
ncbi:MAG: GNAT family N-acetyltransferase [Flavobacteriia bacterium]|jgi:RimJ/RimL family protein N-acetyltransferase